MLKLSIRNKLIASVAVAIIGFLIQGGVSFQVLGELSDSSEAVKQAQNTVAVVKDIHADVLSLTLHTGTLKADEVETFAAHIKDTKSKKSKALNDIVAATQQPELKSLLGKLNTQLVAYMNHLEQWLEIKVRYGIDNNSGLLSALNGKVAELEKVIQGFSGFVRKVSAIRGIEKEFLLSGDAKIAEQFDKQTSDLAKSANDTGFEDFVPQITGYHDAFKAVSAVRQELQLSEELLAADIHVVEDTTKAASQLLNETVVPNVYAEADSLNTQAKSTLALAAVFSALILAGLLTWVGRGINTGLNDTSEFLTHIAEGNLTSRMEGYEEDTDEFGQLADTANAMAENLSQLVSESNGVSQELAGMSNSLSTATDTLVQGNKQITDQSNQVATAAEEMNATVEEVARSTNALHSSAENATEAGKTSLEVIGRTDEAIKNITQAVDDAARIIHSLSESSNRIGMVVDVIDSLAEQTNLLALNAAIEAARAGDAGRGFAVVADEVRNLASKTTEATSQITEIVNQIQSESQGAVKAMDRGQEVAKQGAELGEEAVESINRIGEQTAHTSEQTGHIATAIEEMSATIREMSASIERVAHEIKSNEGAALEMSDTADNVARKAADLQQHAGQFTV